MRPPFSFAQGPPQWPPMLKLMKLAALSLLALGMVAATPACGQIVNGDFDAGLQGWRPQPAAGYEIQTVPALGAGQALRVAWGSEQPPPPRTFAAAAQMFDAAPYRGRQVTVSFRARALRPGDQIALALRVDRPPGGARGFFDNMADRPIRAPEWRTYEVRGYVAPDAVRIYVGLLVAGDGAAEFDSVRVTFSDAKPEAEALAYLDGALQLLRQHHYLSRGANWAAIEREARAAAVGAKTPADTYPAIRHAIAALGERHTFLATPQFALGQGPEAAMPDVTRDGAVGIARLPGLRTAAGDPHGIAAKYTKTLAIGIADQDKAGACGWLIDLREDTGGNMWPMLGGLDALLGPPPFGWFVMPDGRASPWTRVAGNPVSAPLEPAPGSPAPRRPADRPIAVLLGPRTASSGEMTAMALIGRERVRTFGQPTAGLSTPNSSFPLADGAVLVVTTGKARDRTGFQYEGPIQPDETVALAAAEAAALRWLSGEGCKTAP